MSGNESGWEVLIVLWTILVIVVIVVLVLVVLGRR
jgi:heme/copper-type cytochrome/quinol oxidase subunit 4